MSYFTSLYSSRAGSHTHTHTHTLSLSLSLKDTHLIFGRYWLGLVICREFARHRIRRVPYIGVPRAVVERRMQRGQLIGGPQARVPLYVPYADIFQYQAGAGRRASRA